jgi:hypothetical protein
VLTVGGAADPNTVRAMCCQWLSRCAGPLLLLLLLLLLRLFSYLNCDLKFFFHLILL